jgi:hypothetical protein
MQPEELATAFVRRVFDETFGTLAEAAWVDIKVSEFFHPEFEQNIDGKTFDRTAFTSITKTQKARLATPPVFTFKKMIATEPQEGRIHVTSVHSVSAKLKSGDSMLQHVVALIELDVLSGTIISADEITRTETISAVLPATGIALGVARMIRDSSSKAVSRRSVRVNEQLWAPSAKHLRTESPTRSVSRTEPDGSSSTAVTPPPTQLPPTQLPGHVLRRSGVSDLLSELSAG